MLLDYTRTHPISEKYFDIGARNQQPRLALMTTFVLVSS